MGRIMGSQGNFVTCSAKHVAFNIDSGSKDIIIIDWFTVYLYPTFRYRRSKNLVILTISVLIRESKMCL